MASFILWWFFVPRGGFLHSACATVGMTKRGNVFWYYRKQFRPFTCGTAHRPFPTVSLKGGRFQPGCSKDGRYSVVCFRDNRRKGNHTESHRRERPMCRSARERTELFPIKTRHVPHYVIPTASGVEESTTLDKKPPQDKTCYLGRFLDSLRSLGMT